MFESSHSFLTTYKGLKLEVDYLYDEIEEDFFDYL